MKYNFKFFNSHFAFSVFTFYDFVLKRLKESKQGYRQSKVKITQTVFGII